MFFTFSLVFCLSSFLSVYEVRANTVSSSQDAVDVLERLNTGGVDLTCESCTHFSDPASSNCPKEWLKLAVLRGDKRGSLNTSSPDKLCMDKVEKLHSSRDPLKTANEVEAYLRGHKGFSSLKGVPVISQCLSEPVPVNRVGNWSATVFNRTLPESKHKVALAEYYSDLHRLDQGMGETVDHIAAIDRLITPAGSSLLKNVSCGEMLSKEAEESCKAVKKCESSTPESRSYRQFVMNQAANNTIIAMKAIDEMEGKIKRLRSGHTRLRPKDWKAQAARLESSKRDIENLYPWIAGRKFKRAYSADDFKGFSPGGTNNTNLVAKMSGIIKEQLNHTRDRLQKRKEDMYQARLCLTENKCNEVDLERVLSVIPFLDEKKVFASSGGERNLKNMSSSILFTQVNCLQKQRYAKAKVNKELAFAGLDVALIAGTMGLGSGIVGAKMAATAAIRAGGAASKAQKLSRTQKLSGLGVIGADTGVSTPFMHEAMKQCDSLLNQLESLETQTQNKADETNLCENMSLQVKHTSDLKGCMLQAGLASLPAVFGIGALAGSVAIGARVASKSARGTAPSLSPAVADEGARLSKAEEVLGKKLTDEQAGAVQKAHLVGSADKLGKDGINPPGIGNYTAAQLRQKNKILQDAGFSSADRRDLMEAGVVGWIADMDADILRREIQTVKALLPSDIAQNMSSKQIQALKGTVRHFTEQQTRALGTKVNHLTPAQLRALDNRVSVFTEQQLDVLGDKVSALTPLQLVVLEDKVSVFTPAQLGALGRKVKYLAPQQLQALGDSVGDLTPTQLRVLKNKVDVLTPQQIRALGDKVGHLTKHQVKALDHRVVGSLTEQQVRALKGKVKHFTPQQLEALGDKVKHLKFSQIRSLRNNVSAFTPQQLRTLGDKVRDFEIIVDNQLGALGSKVSAFTPQQLEALGDKVRAFTSQQVRALGDKVRVFTPQQLDVLGGRVSAFTPQQLDILKDSTNVFTEQQIRSLGDNVSDFTPLQLVILEDKVSTLTPAQLRGLGRKVKHLAPRQVQALGDSVSSLTPSQLKALYNSRVSALTEQQVRALGDKVGHLTKHQVKALDHRVVGSLTEQQFRALKGKVKHFTPLQLGALGDTVKHFKLLQIHGLGNKVSAFTPQQIRALGDKVSYFENRVAGQLKALGNNVSAFTPRQVSALGEGVIFLTSQQLRALGDSVSGLTPGQLHSLKDRVSAFTPRQIEVIKRR